MLAVIPFIIQNLILLCVFAQEGGASLPQTPIAPEMLSAPAVTVVVEADRITSQEIETARSAVIIDADAIQPKQVATVADVLRDIPGVEVVRSGRVGQVTSVFIRGSDSASTLVLIDGVEVNDVGAPGRGYDFSSLPPHNIARIEVYRGPQSVRFGSGALGGVINIVTKEGHGDFGASYSFEVGSYQTTRAALAAGGQKHDWRYSFGAEIYNTKGFSAAYVPSQSGSNVGEDDGSKTGALSSKIIYSVDAVSKIESTLRYIKTETDLDRGGGAAADDPTYDSESEQIAAGLSGQTRFFGGELLSGLGFYYAKTERESKNARDEAPPTDYLDDHFEGEYFKIDSGHEWSISDTSKLRLDLQWRQDRADADSFSEDSGGGPYVDAVNSEAQSILGEGLTYIYESDTLFADLGVRADQPSETDDVLSHRISIGKFLRGHNLNPKTSKVYLTYGTGFKVPSLYQLYSESFGNRNLDQEESSTIEGTLQLERQGVLSTLTIYENKYRDLIDFSGMNYYNVKKAKSRGIEVNASGSVVDGVLLKASFAYLDSEDETTGLQLLRRPRRTYGLEVNWATGRVTSFIKYRFRGYRADSDPVTFTRTTMGSYGMVDLGSEYKFSDKLAAHARIENVFDKKYQEIAGYGTAEQSFYLGLSGRF